MTSDFEHSSALKYQVTEVMQQLTCELWQKEKKIQISEYISIDCWLYVCAYDFVLTCSSRLA